VKDLESLPARPRAGVVHFVVESPAGSKVKLAWDASLGAFTLSRPLTMGLVYPFDWGFIPSTRAPDGDPLDCMLLIDAPTYPGVVIPARPIGVVRVSQKKKRGGGRERNDRVLAVPVDAPRQRDLRDARRLALRIRRELDHFFTAAVALEDKDARILGWGGPAEAQRLVDGLAPR
jgi:inorganic pyrophosphatase